MVKFYVTTSMWLLVGKYGKYKPYIHADLPTQPRKGIKLSMSIQTIEPHYIMGFIRGVPNLPIRQTTHIVFQINDIIYTTVKKNLYACRDGVD